ncbi:hypothetical protein [Sorangium sp. So ce1024]|uniref:hypothetical protein n=1 Tax=Sorangium sp. So ce1024 TaxID=3133327 RepID=UPI003F09650F
MPVAAALLHHIADAPGRLGGTLHRAPAATTNAGAAVTATTNAGAANAGATNAGATNAGAAVAANTGAAVAANTGTASAATTNAGAANAGAANAGAANAATTNAGAANAGTAAASSLATGPAAANAASASAAPARRGGPTGCAAGGAGPSSTARIDEVPLLRRAPRPERGHRDRQQAGSAPASPRLTRSRSHRAHPFASPSHSSGHWRIISCAHSLRRGGAAAVTNAPFEPTRDDRLTPPGARRGDALAPLRAQLPR